VWRQVTKRESIDSQWGVAKVSKASAGILHVVNPDIQYIGVLTAHAVTGLESKRRCGALCAGHQHSLWLLVSVTCAEHKWLVLCSCCAIWPSCLNRIGSRWPSCLGGTDTDRALLLMVDG